MWRKFFERWWSRYHTGLYKPDVEQIYKAGWIAGVRHTKKKCADPNSYPPSDSQW